MTRTYEFRLHPTPSQKRRLTDCLDACRGTYNWALEDRRDLWQYGKCSTGFCDQSRWLKELKKQRPSLEGIHVHVLQTALKRVDLAFQAFFRRVKTGEKPGYPRFKGKDWFDSFSFKEYGNGFGLEGKRLRLSGIGRVRIRRHRDIVGEIKTCTIKRRADGWHALFGVEQEPVLPELLWNPVGVDMGLNSFAVLSNGEKIKNPRFLKDAQDDLTRQQRILSRRKKGSGRRKKARSVLARKHLKVERCRKDFHCNLAARLAREFKPIIVERLDIKGLIEKAVEDKKQHKRFAAKSENILDAAWGKFLQRLGSKAESAGSAIVAVEPRGTSQECSRCGATVRKGLGERTHSCPWCDLVMDRDENAARNILSRGLKELESLTGWAVPSGSDRVVEPAAASRQFAEPPENREASPLQGQRSVTEIRFLVARVREGDDDAMAVLQRKLRDGSMGRSAEYIFSLLLDEEIPGDERGLILETVACARAPWLETLVCDAIRLAIVDKDEDMRFAGVASLAELPGAYRLETVPALRRLASPSEPSPDVRRAAEAELVVLERKRS